MTLSMSMAPDFAATARHFALLEAAGHAVIATDMEGTIGHWSDAARDLYGWSREEVIGRNVVDVTPAEIARDEAVTIMSTLTAGEVWSGTFNVRDRSGRQFRASVTDLPLRQRARSIGIVGVSAMEAAPPTDVRESLALLERAAGAVWPRGVKVEAADTDGVTLRVGQPHLTQLFALLLLREAELLDAGEEIAVTAQRCTREILADFAMLDSRDWLYIRFGRHHRSAQQDRDPLWNASPSRYAASLVDIAAGRLFTTRLPRSRAAFHMFLPVDRAR